jgi:hypothetical protein
MAPIGLASAARGARTARLWIGRRAETATGRRRTSDSGPFRRLSRRHAARLTTPGGQASTSYEPRDPAGNVLYQIVRDHFETFRVEAASLRDGDGLPRFVAGGGRHAAREIVGERLAPAVEDDAARVLRHDGRRAWRRRERPAFDRNTRSSPGGPLIMPTDTSATVRSPPTCWSPHCDHRHNPAVGTMSHRQSASDHDARRGLSDVADDGSLCSERREGHLHSKILTC